LKSGGTYAVPAAAFTVERRDPISGINPDDGFRAFRNVMKSLMRDASAVINEAGAGAGSDELRERLATVGHYVRYALEYCDECPLINEAPREFPRLRTIEFPGSN
jgi:hypothetical protein